MIPVVMDPPQRSFGGLPGHLRVISLIKALCVLAPTLVIQGTVAGLLTVLGSGPSLPADVATKTPASAANRKAIWSAPVRLAPPPIE